MTLDAVIVLAILAITLFAFFSRYKSSKLPPGPWSVPILGHLPLLGDQPAQTILKWKKTYGPIISVQLGSYSSVVINDATLIKAAFNLPEFAGRPQVKLLDDYSKGRKGILFSDGPHSSEQRQFIRRYLKDFGYGSRTMETIITEQITQLLQNLENKSSKPLRVNHFFNGYTVNSLWSIVSGEPLDPEGSQTKELASAVTRGASFPGIVDKLMLFLPQLQIWFPNWSGYSSKIQASEDLLEFAQKIIDQTKISRVRNQPRMVLDAYSDKMDDTTDLDSPFHAKHGNLRIALRDLFAAGVETTSTTLEWTLFHLAQNPEVQTKLQNEIDKVIGSSRLPSMTDKPQMPYSEAVMSELLRIATVLPLSLFHRTLEKVEFGGYSIPANTMVIGNLYAAHNDPDVWKDPQVFRPERFLDKDGNFMKIADFIPFSWGKRVCLGENLARLQLFLFIVSIFQRFEIRPSGPFPPQDGNFGITVAPGPFHVTVKGRY